MPTPDEDIAAAITALDTVFKPIKDAKNPAQAQQNYAMFLLKFGKLQEVIAKHKFNDAGIAAGRVAHKMNVEAGAKVFNKWDYAKHKPLD